MLDKQHRIIFSQDENIIISEILQKYKVNEPPDEEVFGNPDDENISVFPSIIILRIVADVIRETVSIKNVSQIIQKQLNLSPKVAEEMAKDIEIKLINIAQKVKVEKPIINQEKLSENHESIIGKLKKLPLEPEEEEKEEVLKTAMKPLSQEKKSSPQKNDVYREPIE